MLIINMTLVTENVFEECFLYSCIKPNNLAFLPCNGKKVFYFQSSYILEVKLFSRQCTQIWTLDSSLTWPVTSYYIHFWLFSKVKTHFLFEIEKKKSAVIIHYLGSRDEETQNWWQLWNMHKCSLGLYFMHWK